MKKLVLTIVCAVCALLVSGPLYADEGKCGDNLTYRFDETTGTLTISGQGEMWGFSNKTGDIILPWVSSYKESVIKVVVEKGITSIGMGAFLGCKNLVSVTLPEGLIVIDNGAFGGCSKIISIKIPSTVEYIGMMVFTNCESLQSLVVPASLKKWYLDKPNGLSDFKGCSSLTSITWNAKNIKDFSGFGVVSDQITSFKFGNSVKFIPADICKNMRRLKAITLPKSVEEIGDMAFYGCERLATVTCYAPEPPFIGHGAFLYDYPTEFYVPEGSVSEYKKVIWRTIKPIQK